MRNKGCSKEKIGLGLVALGGTVSCILGIFGLPASGNFWRFAATAAIVVCAFILVILKMRRVEAMWNKRDSLSETEIINQFSFENPVKKHCALEVWREIEDIFNVPPGRLRASDRFGQELGGESITDGCLDDFRRKALERIGPERLEELDKRSAVSVLDYIQISCEEMKFGG